MGKAWEKLRSAPVTLMQFLGCTIPKLLSENHYGRSPRTNAITEIGAIWRNRGLSAVLNNQRFRWVAEQLHHPPGPLFQQ